RLARACRDAYAGNVPVDDPGVSPARRPLDASAPPTAIVCGGDDFVVDDVRRFVEASRSRGATIDLRVWPGMIHCFPVVAGTPEGASALAVLAVHIGSAVGGASDPRRED
ncbi:alpha/beta hydrolase, partial [Dietzia sp. SLG510A3-3B2-2]|nr:alpha/beta hydrolase [Dietzia sp. SLG510A3-3B2-2]